jgi:preprotein translocase subunit SecG
MLYELLTALFVLLCFFITFIVLIQKTKSSLGIGTLGGGTQMLFGGSGGQDIFQKITWGCGATFMLLSFMLAIMKSGSTSNARYLSIDLPEIEIVQQEHSVEQNS